MSKEIWKKIDFVKYVPEDKYEISNKGRLKSFCKNKNGIILRHCERQDNEYCLARLSGIEVLVHRLVAEAFIPNPDNLPEVNHKDGKKNHNWVENLEWVSKSDNEKHKWKMGLVINKENIRNNMKKLNKIYAEQNHLKTCKSVNIYDLDGNLVKQTNSVYEAAEYLRLKCAGNVTECCKGYRKTVGGSYYKIWRK